MKEKLITIGLWIVVICVIGSIIYGGFWLKRTFNNWMYYDDTTSTKICEMVQKEHLTPEGLKICKDAGFYSEN